jgi:hypothetical protein
MNTAIIIGAFSVLASIITGMVTYMVTRRTKSGQISTSEAATLWAESQDMRRMLMEDKRRIEEQRDKLLDSSQSQIIVTLGSVNTTIKNVLALINELLRRINEIYPMENPPPKFDESDKNE